MQPRRDREIPKKRDIHKKEKPAKQTHWHEVTGWYDQLVGDEGSEYHREVILPGIFRMLAIKTAESNFPQTRKKLLDLACGQGVVCRAFAQKGWQAIGVDAAAGLIRAAQERNRRDGLSIDYLTADVTKLYAKETGIAPEVAPTLKADSFDAATLILAIQNITPLSPLWQAAAAMLKPMAPLIIVMMHPSFRNPQKTHWGWDEDSKLQYRRVEEYLSSTQTEIQTNPGLAAHGKSAARTVHFHRPLQAYINTLGSAGLWIDHIEEWPSHKKSQPGPKSAALDKSRREIPMFLAIRAKKILNYEC